VAEAFRLHASPTADDVPAVLAVVDSPVLSPDLRRQFLRHLRRLQRPGGPAWEGFRAVPDPGDRSVSPLDHARGIVISGPDSGVLGL
jgi:hypothetical protein